MRTSKADGFALIDLLFVVGIIGILSAIGMPRLMAARQSAAAAGAVGTMRAVHSGELTFAFTCGYGFYAPSLTTLGTPPAGSNDAFISPSLSSADTLTHAGYVIRLEADPFPGAPPSCNGVAAGDAGRSFKAGADPVVADVPRYFAINAEGEIWEDQSSLFAAMPEVGEPPTGHPAQ